jgi:hypothetical protein
MGLALTPCLYLGLALTPYLMMGLARVTLMKRLVSYLFIRKSISISQRGSLLRVWVPWRWWCLELHRCVCSSLFVTASPVGFWRFYLSRYYCNIHPFNNSFTVSPVGLWTIWPSWYNCNINSFIDGLGYECLPYHPSGEGTFWKGLNQLNISDSLTLH